MRLLFSFIAYTAAVSGLSAPIASKGFILPDNTRDGVYQAFFNASGHEVHERISDGLTTTEILATSASALDEAHPPVSPNPLHGRQWVIYSWCGCGLIMNGHDCDAAVQDLKNQIGGGAQVVGPWSYYSIRGSVIAFVCTDYQLTQTFNRDAVTQAAAISTSNCGWYVPGTVSGLNISPLPYYGYMNWFPGLNVCQAARSSGYHDCH